MSNVGLKFDDDKLRYDLVPWKEFEEVVKVITEGAKRYSEYNWQKVEPKKRYWAAAMRHMIAWALGKRINREDFGCSHLSHAVVSLLFLMWKDNNEEVANEAPKNNEDRSADLSS